MRQKGEGSIFQDSRGYWVASMSFGTGPDGKRRRKVVRRKSRDAAIRRLAEMQLERRRRGDLTTGNVLVADWFPYWMEQIVTPRLRPNTVAAYSAAVNNHIIPAIGRRRIDELQASDIRWVYERMMSLGASSTTARQTHHVMRSAFKTAVRERKIDFNPCEMVDAPRARVANLEALEIEEAIDFLRYCQSLPEGAMWATSVLTGARRGEVLGLTRGRVTSSLDFSWQLQSYKENEHGKPVVPQGFEYEIVDRRVYLTRPKSRAGWRIVPLVEPLRTMLVRQMQSTLEHPHGLVFTHDGKAIRPDSMSYLWRKFRTSAGITKDIRLHDLRHTAVDLFYLAGVPEDLIIEIVGHSSHMMTRSYKTRGNDARLRHAMKQVSELFGVEQSEQQTVDPFVPVCPHCWITCEKSGRAWRCPNCELRMLG